MISLANIQISPANLLFQSQIDQFRRLMMPTNSDLAPTISNTNDFFSGNGYAACIHNELIGLITFDRADETHSGSPQFFITGGVLAQWRRKGLGGQLLQQALLRMNALSPRGRAVVYLPPTDATTHQGEVNDQIFFLQRGFHALSTHLFYEGEVSCTMLPDTSEAHGFVGHVYTGGNDLCDQSISALHNASFRRGADYSEVTADSIKKMMLMPDVHFFLLKQKDTLVGYARCTLRHSTYFIGEIAVRRQFWAKGATNALGNAIVRDAVARGKTTLAGFVDSDNTAARSFNERFGLTIRMKYPRLSLTWK